MDGRRKRAIELAPDVWRIPTVGSAAINSFAFVEDSGAVVLVDAGLRGAPRKLVAALAEIGRSPSDVRVIVCTHAHGDHVGGLPGMHAAGAGRVHIHEDDAGYLREGRRPPADPARPLARILAFAGPGIPACEADATFREGDVLEANGPLRVLHTPGHSPGHCSFLHEPSGVLITGDALFNMRRVRYSFALFCSNYRMSVETADRLGEVDYGIAAFTHGPEIRDGAREAVRAFLRRRLQGVQ